MDGVFFNKEHREWLSSRKDFKTVWYAEEEGSVPYTPYRPTHYMYCGEKTRALPTLPPRRGIDRFGTERVARLFAPSRAYL